MTAMRRQNSSSSSIDIAAMLRSRAGVCLALILSGSFAARAGGAENQTLTRADGAQVSVRVYGVAPATCKGIAVLSPGAGGTEKGLSYLAEALSRDGWLSVVVGHKESGPSVLRADMHGFDVKAALLKMTTDRAAYEARWMDIGAALDWCAPELRQAVQRAARTFDGRGYGHAGGRRWQ